MSRISVTKSADHQLSPHLDTPGSAHIAHNHKESAKLSPTPTPRFDVFKDWDKVSLAPSPDAHVKLDAIPHEAPCDTPSATLLNPSHSAPHGFSAISATHTSSNAIGGATPSAGVNKMADWTGTAFDTPPTSQAWPSLPGNGQQLQNPASGSRSNSQHMWGSLKNGTPNGYSHGYDVTKSRTASQVSSRGGQRPRGNAGRNSLVPPQVRCLQQAQGTLVAANADLNNGVPLLSARQQHQDRPNSNWGRYSNGRDRGVSFSQNMKAAKRRNRWPSPADFKASSKHDTAAEEDALDVASAQADAGDGAGKLFRPIKPGEDATLDIRDWNGDWAPAPADWEERPMFVGLDFEKRVIEWNDGYDDSLTTMMFLPNPDRQEPIPCRQVTVPEREEFISARGEICPHDWVLDGIDSGAIVGTMRPFLDWYTEEQKRPLHPDVARDTDDTTKPYWDRYTGWNHEQLTSLRIPEAKVDARDNDVTLIQRQTAEMSLARMDNEQLRRMDRHRKDKKEKQRVQRDMENYVPARNEYSPEVNIYLRPYDRTDVPSIQEFYNYWVENSIYVAEMHAVECNTLEERIGDIVNSDLPCIVAVDRSNKPRVGRGPRQRQNTQPDHIVGIAFADDYHDYRSMHRYTVEIECYVRPEYVRKGVGRTLMDKLMSILDIGYEPVEGYEFVCNQDDMEEKNRYTNGGKRQVGQIIVQLLHNSDDKSKLDWNANWLKQRWGFKQKGYLDDIGRKLSTR